MNGVVLRGGRFVGVGLTEFRIVGVAGGGGGEGKSAGIHVMSQSRRGCSRRKFLRMKDEVRGPSLLRLGWKLEMPVAEAEKKEV